VNLFVCVCFLSERKIWMFAIRAVDEYPPVDQQPQSPTIMPSRLSLQHSLGLNGVVLRHEGSTRLDPLILYIYQLQITRQQSPRNLITFDTTKHSVIVLWTEVLPQTLN
jgi:hypothetical protein